MPELVSVNHLLERSLQAGATVFKKRCGYSKVAKYPSTIIQKLSPPLLPPLSRPLVVTRSLSCRPPPQAGTIHTASFSPARTGWPLALGPCLP
jgi:hypothetical protein